MSVQRASFTRNLKGYLASAKLSRISRTTKSLSTEPVDAVDSLFTGVGENYQSPDHLGGYRSITQQLLADDVLDSLIKLQSEIASFDDHVDELSASADRVQENKNARATQAYSRAQENYRPLPFNVYYDAG
jgi:hypothetical protein